MQRLVEQCIQEALNNGGIAPSSAQGLMGMEDNLLPLLFSGASRIRHHFHGQGIKLCAIVNAKSGRCPEDCAFCAQSAHHQTQVETYPLMDPQEILHRAQEAKAMGARRFAIVTSGKALTEKELAKAVEAIRLIKEETGLIPCASLGMITKKAALQLKAAGLNRFHHNLETAHSFFPRICTTHAYEEDLDTLRTAQEAGLQVCSGGIFGLGETRAQRLELAYTLKEMGVDSVALNFLDPIPGTPLERAEILAPLELLRFVALFRFILPDRDIRICGGRESGLRDLHPLVFWAGADGIMIGNYLTTKGRDHHADLQMIQDLGMEVLDG
ncbi:MAG: biotin synthase BioB [Desulfobacterales bacterium]|nr:biotin synthase BioB [Desulfobacterales bacterium]